MFKPDLLGADVIDSMVWDIMNSVKADAKMLEDKYDETDEYQYYQDAEDLKKVYRTVGTSDRPHLRYCSRIQTINQTAHKGGTFMLYHFNTLNH